jgi:hypothetical protein
MSYLAQPLQLQLQPACAGTYLRWLTPLGDWPGWLFAGDIDDKTDVAEATDIATADGRTAVAVRRAATDTLTIRTGLTTLLDSPQVYRQLANGARQPVLVLANSSVSRTNADGRHELELTLNLPNRNALTN